MRSEYWSNTKFSDWLRGTPRPFALEMHKWREWEAAAKAAHPIRYWLAEDFLDTVQNIVSWPFDMLYAAKYRLVNRFVTYTHGLTSHQLNKYQWHDLDTRLMFSIFDELVNFVEIEVASMQIAFNPELKDKYAVPWYTTGPFKTRTVRCPQAGIDYLNVSSTYTYGNSFDVPETDPRYNDLTDQALAAIEILKLYDWWKNVYPVRPEPMTASGLSDYYEDKTLESISADNKPMSKDVKDMHDMCNNLEKQYYDEDTEMLCRVIKIRSNLWT